MGDLVQSVTNGIIENTAREIKQNSSGNGLGKDAFLQLLCTQMQYQDPLNPQTDTEFVAQLAQYSQLEELQNLSAANENSQALGLLGKNVIIKTSTDASVKETFLRGTVDFVSYVNGKVKLSVKDKLYSMSDLYSVIDDAYLIQQGLPGIDKEVKAEVDCNNPEDVTFDVNLGKESTVATQVGFILNGKIVDAKYVKMDGNTVTLSKDLFTNLKNGTYNIAIMFNDILGTVVTDKISVTVKNSTVQENPSVGESTKPSDDTSGTKEETSKSSTTDVSNISDEDVNKLVEDRD